MAFNPLLLKLYNYTKFIFNNINEFVKGQAYIVSTFHLKIDKQSLPIVCKMWLYRGRRIYRHKYACRGSL